MTDVSHVHEATPLSSRTDIKPKRKPADRHCSVIGCTTRLSAYNGGQKCWLHSPARYPRASVR